MLVLYGTFYGRWLAFALDNLASSAKRFMICNGSESFHIDLCYSSSQTLAQSLSFVRWFVRSHIQKVA